MIKINKKLLKQSKSVIAVPVHPRGYGLFSQGVSQTITAECHGYEMGNILIEVVNNDKDK